MKMTMFLRSKWFRASVLPLAVAGGVFRAHAGLQQLVFVEIAAALMLAVCFADARAARAPAGR